MASCLSTIRLASWQLLNVFYGGDLAKFFLPSSLQHFEFEGAYLFTGDGKLCLCENNVLTELKLSPVRAGSEHA